jgi:hypothetical protein
VVVVVEMGGKIQQKKLSVKGHNQTSVAIGQPPLWRDSVATLLLLGVFCTRHHSLHCATPSVSIPWAWRLPPLRPKLHNVLEASETLIVPLSLRDWQI